MYHIVSWYNRNGAQMLFDLFTSNSIELNRTEPNQNEPSIESNIMDVK